MDPSDTRVVDVPIDAVAAMVGDVRLAGHGG